MKVNKTRRLLIAGIFLFAISCSKPKNDFDKTPTLSTPQDTVNLPLVSLPADADPTSDSWNGIDLTPKAPVTPLSVNEEKNKFLLQPGYKLDPVLTEPQIQQPGAITFDGNGRMYVLELRTYMLTVESEGTLEPVSAISRWEDKDNDGFYEKGGTFVDSLVFPRFVLPFGPNSVLTMESNTDNVYLYTDTDNDGKADKKEFFTDNFGRPGNVEHQQAFLYWGMDNWLYSTVNPFRVRWTPSGVIREATGSNHAQWGISHDDDGKLWFQGGSNGVPSYFQFPIHYGDYIVKDVNYAEGFEVPWGAAVKIADMQGGMGQVRMPEGTLNRVTGAAGNDVYRGDRLPKALYGQYFYGEPVARIVRQINPTVNEGLTTLHNVFQDQKSEFIRSTDPLFRPVDMTTAPDGTMYITDMYHGIIQEGQWTPAGSYLRAKIEQYQLDKVIGLGRIWRLSHQDMERDKTQPKVYDQPSSELLAHLSHPNGWWRDMAQQVLVQRQDKSIAPALVNIVKTSDNLLERFHAMWVLEGIGALDASLVREMMRDTEPRMRLQAMWVGETLYKAGDSSLGTDYIKMMSDDNTMVKMRAMMTGRLLKIPGTEATAKALMETDKSAGVQLVAQQVLEPIVVNSFFGRSNPNYSEDEQVLLAKGADIYNSLCATCHGVLGQGAPGGAGKLMAPSLAASKRVKGHPDYVIKTLLHGMTGDIEGNSYTGIMMAPMGNNDDEWIAAAASFIRANFENESSLVTPEDVALVRAKTADQTKSYSYKELVASVPKLLMPTDDWKMTASHAASVRKGSTASAKGAFNFEGWTTGITQEAGMWYQVQLPKPATITEIHFTSSSIRRGRGPDAPPPLQTYPKEFDLEVSMDGKQWTKVLDKVAGEKSSTAIKIAPVETKYLRMTLTKSESIVHGEVRGKPNDFEVPWTMSEVKLYGFME